MARVGGNYSSVKLASRPLPYYFKGAPVTPVKLSLHLPLHLSLPLPLIDVSLSLPALNNVPGAHRIVGLVLGQLLKLMLMPLHIIHHP